MCTLFTPRAWEISYLHLLQLDFQALAYSERSRVHDVLSLLLAAPLRPWLLKSMLPDDVAEFLKLRARLNKYAQCLQVSTQTSRYGEISYSSDARLHGMLREAAKMTMLFRNIGDHSGGPRMKLLQLCMPPIMDVDPSIWHQAPARDRDEVILEWLVQANHELRICTQLCFSIVIAFSELIFLVSLIQVSWNRKSICFYNIRKKYFTENN